MVFYNVLGVPNFGDVFNYFKSNAIELNVRHCPFTA